MPAWRRGFTKTIFLAGNPANLMDRFEFTQVDEDRSVAWLAPVPSSVSYTLRRLLRLFEGAAALPVRNEFLVRQVPRLAGIGERFDALRIGPDPTSAERLRAFGGLTEVLHD